MSGVSGSDRISRKEFQKVLKDYKEKVISKFPGFVSLEPSGSYNSDKTKSDFGDMDLILTIRTDLDKKALKSQLAKFMSSFDDKTIVPFTSDKYKGKKYYNSGEIITVNYPQDSMGLKTVQIDNIIALDPVEAKFKKDFLDMPAEKQGLVLGLVKVATLESKPEKLFKKLGINVKSDIEKNQEFEFNLSSKEIQLRLVTYDADLLAKGTYKQLSRTIEWTGRDFTKLEDLLFQFKLDVSFTDLVNQSKVKLKNARSLRRISGVFKSMISIKSGEVGTDKGANKQKALDKVQKIFGESTFRGYLNEISEGTGVFLGRFQPVTKAHYDIIQKMSKENKNAVVLLVKGKKSSLDTDANPFDAETQMKMLELIAPKNVKIAIIPTGYYPDYVPQGKIRLYAGSDRIKGYERMGKDLDLEMVELKRTDEDISATKVRNAIKEDDEATFKKLTPKEIHSMYNELKDIMNG